MAINTTLFTGLGLVLLTTIGAHGVVVVDDTDGALGAARAPVTAIVKLNRSQRRAAEEGRLQLRELQPAASFAGLAVPVQILGPEADKSTARLGWLMPPGIKASRRFELQTVRRTLGAQVTAKQDARHRAGALTRRATGRPCTPPVNSPARGFASSAGRTHRSRARGGLVPAGERA